MILKTFFLNIEMNGELFSLETFTYFTIDDLISFFNFKKKLVVLEYNGKICTPLLWKKIILKNKDKLEIITIVGGG